MVLNTNQSICLYYILTEGTEGKDLAIAVFIDVGEGGVVGVVGMVGAAVVVVGVLTGAILDCEFPLMDGSFFFLLIGPGCRSVEPLVIMSINILLSWISWPAIIRNQFCQKYTLFIQLKKHFYNIIPQYPSMSTPFEYTEARFSLQKKTEFLLYEANLFYLHKTYKNAHKYYIF